MIYCNLTYFNILTQTQALGVLYIVVVYLTDSKAAKYNVAMAKGAYLNKC